jgi:hypothetical protein
VGGGRGWHLPDLHLQVVRPVGADPQLIPGHGGGRPLIGQTRGQGANALPTAVMDT